MKHFTSVFFRLFHRFKLFFPITRIVISLFSDPSKISTLSLSLQPMEDNNVNNYDPMPALPRTEPSPG